MTLNSTDQLTALTGRKLETLSRLRELGLQQIELIVHGKTDQLLRLLNLKRGLIQDFQETEKQIGPFRDEPPEKRSWRDQEERSRCAKMVEICKKLHREVLQLERESETLLSAQRNAIGEKLQSAHQAGSARRAYGSIGSVANGPTQIETRG